MTRTKNANKLPLIESSLNVFGVAERALPVYIHY